MTDRDRGEGIVIPVLPMVRIETIEKHGPRLPEPTPEEKRQPLYRYLAGQSEQHLFGGVMVARLLKLEASSQGKTLNEPTQNTVNQLKVRLEQRKQEYLRQTGLQSPRSAQDAQQNLSKILELLRAGNDPTMPVGQDFRQENPEIFRLLDYTSLSMNAGSMPWAVGVMSAGAYMAYEAYRMQAEKDQGKA